jgi:hypothetical protein
VYTPSFVQGREHYNFKRKLRCDHMHKIRHQLTISSDDLIADEAQIAEQLMIMGFTVG